jgi:hypothetical protein
MVDDAGAIENIASDVADGFQDGLEIADAIYEGGSMNERTRQSATLPAGCGAVGLAAPAAARTDPVSAAPTSDERKTR